MRKTLPEFRNCASCGALIRLGQIHNCHKVVEKELKHEELFSHRNKKCKCFAPQQKPTEDWIKRFDDRFTWQSSGPDGDGYDVEPRVWDKEKISTAEDDQIDDIKSFIKDLLAKQKDELVKQFISGQLCFNCGEDKKSDMSDLCVKCAEEI